MLRIITQQGEVQAELQRICDRTQDDQVQHKEATVREVLQAVKRQGDKAVLHYTAEFDNKELLVEDLRVSGSELDAAYQQVSRAYSRDQNNGARKSPLSRRTGTNCRR